MMRVTTSLCRHKEEQGTCLAVVMIFHTECMNERRNFVPYSVCHLFVDSLDAASTLVAFCSSYDYSLKRGS